MAGGRRIDSVEDAERAFGLKLGEVSASPSDDPAAPAPAPAARALFSSSQFTDDFAGFRFLSERPERTIELLYPFELGGKEFRSYTLRRLNAGQMTEVAAELRRTENIGVVYSAISGLPFIALRLMDADDQEALAAAAVNFMPAFLRGLEIDPFAGPSEPA